MAGKTIRQHMYALLEAGEVVEVVRDGLALAKLKVTSRELGGALRGVTVASIDSLRYLERQTLFYTILQCDQQRVNLALIGRYHDWRFVAATACFWARTTCPPEHLVRALLLCFMLCSWLSDSKLNTLHRRVCKVPPAFRQSQEWLDALHWFTQWQVIYHMAWTLNTLLMEPMLVFSPAFLYDGELAMYLASSNDVSRWLFEVDRILYDHLVEIVLGARLLTPPRDTEPSLSSSESDTASLAQDEAVGTEEDGTSQHNQETASDHLVDEQQSAAGTSTMPQQQSCKVESTPELRLAGEQGEEGEHEDSTRTPGIAKPSEAGATAFRQVGDGQSAPSTKAKRKRQRSRQKRAPANKVNVPAGESELTDIKENPSDNPVCSLNNLMAQGVTPNTTAAEAKPSLVAPAKLLPTATSSTNGNTTQAASPPTPVSKPKRKRPRCRKAQLAQGGSVSLQEGETCKKPSEGLSKDAPHGSHSAGVEESASLSRAAGVCGRDLSGPEASAPPVAEKQTKIRLQTQKRKSSSTNKTSLKGPNSASVQQTVSQSGKDGAVVQTQPPGTVAQGCVAQNPALKELAKDKLTAAQSEKASLPQSGDGSTAARAESQKKRRSRRRVRASAVPQKDTEKQETAANRQKSVVPPSSSAQVTSCVSKSVQTGSATAATESETKSGPPTIQKEIRTPTVRAMGVPAQPGSRTVAAVNSAHRVAHSAKGNHVSASGRHDTQRPSRGGPKSTGTPPQASQSSGEPLLEQEPVVKGKRKRNRRRRKTQQQPARETPAAMSTPSHHVE